MTMTDTEAKALAIRASCGLAPYESGALHDYIEATEARHAAELREQAERFEAFQQEVSKAIQHYKADGEYKAYMALASFILPSPDPLKSWMHKSGYEGNSVVEQALADLAQNGGKIVWEAGE